MYKMFGLSVRKCYSCKYVNHLLVVRPTLQSKSVSVSIVKSYLRSKHSHVLNNRSLSIRWYSAETGEKATTQRLGKKDRDTFAIIDQDVQEQLFFLDLSEAEEGNDDQLPEHLRIGDPTVSQKVERKTGKRTVTELHHKALELQLQSLEAKTKVESIEDSFIDFHDIGYSHEETSKRKKAKKQHKIYGTPDAEVFASDISCCGCGALMHCTDSEIAGYLPSEKYKRLVEEDKLKKAICQRCYLLVHHQKALNVTMSKEEYRDIVKQVKSQKALVLLIVDLLDIPDSIIKDLPELVGKNKHILILGNKVDLLPQDSDNYLQRIRRHLAQCCADVGVPSDSLKNIHLISAKTGYGIENLITSLQTSWKYNGDVYLVGMANAGKSTLFNTLLESDYCKSRASSVIHKATISPWPGTTLNLLKFPIINPTPYRMFKRGERLKQMAQQTEGDLSPKELKRIQQFSKQGYLVGHVGRTFHVNPKSNKKTFEFDPDSLSFGEDMEDDIKPTHAPDPELELTYNEIKDAHWFHDTPGIMKESDVLNILHEREVKLVVPTQAITPRTFVMKPGMVLLIGALARIDYLEGDHSCWFSVLASSRVPVHITSLDKADAIYQRHAGHALLGVPEGGEERMREFPPLISQDFELHGKGQNQATADIKLSSAGWVAVTGTQGKRLLVRAHAPEAAGLCLRSPPLLPHIANLKGERIKKSPAYKTKKPQTLVDTRLPAQTAEKLKVKKKK